MQIFPARLEKIRRPDESIVHLVFRGAQAKRHLTFVLAPPMTGVFLTADAPLSGATPHPSQAMLRRVDASQCLGVRRAPGLWELVFASGQVLNISFRRKARGVWWADAPRLAGELELSAGSMEPVTWRQLEAQRLAAWASQWRHKERLRIERQRTKLLAAQRGESPDRLRDLGARANALRHAVRRDEKRWLIPSYDGSSSDAIEDAQASGVSELVDRLFHRAQRAERRLRETTRRLELLTSALEGLDQAEPPDLNAPRKAQTALKTPSGVKRFDLLDGHTLWVGRNAQANHRVTFKLARGRDLWFHLRDGPGSHVILTLERGEAPHDDLVLAGAALALHYSSLRGERAEVRVAYRRDLDPLAGHQGKVLVRRERSVLIDPSDAATREVLSRLGLELTSMRQ